MIHFEDGLAESLLSRRSQNNPGERRSGPRPTCHWFRWRVSDSQAKPHRADWPTFEPSRCRTKFWSGPEFRRGTIPCRL
jgi:hypothetical protein